MAIHRPKRQIAGRLGATVYQHHAGTALAFATTQFGARQAQLIAQKTEQRGFVWRGKFDVLGIDSDHGLARLLSVGCVQRLKDVVLGQGQMANSNLECIKQGIAQSGSYGPLNRLASTQ